MIKQFNREISENIREFKKHITQYLFLFLNSGFVASGVMLALCSFLAGWVLKKAGIPYITHTTIPMFLKQPWALLALLVILLMLVYVAFFQYSALFLGMRDIRNSNYSFKKTFKDSIRVMKSVPPQAMLILAVYIVLALPLAGLLVTGQDIFTKVQIPKFITDFMLTKWYLAIILIALYITATYIALRYMYVLPLVVLKNKNVKEALKESAEMTKGKIPSLLGKMLIISIRMAVVQLFFLVICLVFQYFMDDLFTDYADISVMIVLSVITIFEMYYPIRIFVTTIYCVVPSEMFEYTEEMRAEKQVSAQEKKRHLLPLALLVSITLIVSTLSSYIYVFDLYASDPLVISHRGVDGENGVQNTIPAMEATIKSSHPDYIEIDIHETKDGKFVLMHDENLNALCGVDAVPHDLTLDELTKLDAKENGFTAKVCSFDDYLKYADEHDQKLLIEIKGTSYDSEDMVERFVAEYGADIIENGHLLHSMQYDIVEKICGSELAGHETEPVTYEGIPLYMGCIIPFNVLYPNTNASEYTMEETTINYNIVQKAYAEGKQIFAWTVNEVSDMRSMTLCGVDGIITDNPSMLRETLESMGATGYAELVMQRLIDSTSGN